MARSKTHERRIAEQCVTEARAMLGVGWSHVSDDVRWGLRDLHTIVRELSDVMSVAAASESDGYVSPEEADRELAEWADVERVMSARREWLRRAQRERGLRVVGGVR